MLRAASRLKDRRAPGTVVSLLSGAAVASVAIYQHRSVVHAESSEPASSWSLSKFKPAVFSERNIPLAGRFLSGKSNTDDDASDGQGIQTKGPSPPPQTKRHATKFDDVDAEGGAVSAWHSTTNRIADLSDSFTGFDFGALRDKLRDVILPAWVKALPGFVQKLQSELSMAPWSLGWEIWEEAHDPEVNPEILWKADVRVSSDLCREEQSFLRNRKVATRKALAKYLDVPESEIHPDDVPVIAMCGSGGGLRALVAGTSSYLSTQQEGLFDCVTYTAGVSGSCWLQTLYNSSIGRQSHQRMIDHFKHRLDVHICFPPAALALLSQAPTNKFLLSGLVEKLKGVPEADFGVVDIYGLLLAARLLVPRGELAISDYDLKVSNQRFYTDDGRAPLPIYTAVRHEIPEEERESRSQNHESGITMFSNEHRNKLKRNENSGTWFQWFEWTPYEFFCEEFETGIPTWAVGRKFDGGTSLTRENGLFLPELRIPLMMGIWGSAFCATLSHYYKEIRPIIKACGFGSLDSLMVEKDQDLIKLHPIDPASIPNFALGMRGKLPSTCPESLHSDSHLRLMDAGMSNNLPVYPLLRPGRNVDVIIAFDASADVKTDNWIKVADGYARQRNVKGWPVGAGWPPRSNTDKQSIKQLEGAQAATAEQADTKLQSAQEATARGQDDDLGYCTVWVGTTEERKVDGEPSPSNRLRTADDDRQLISPQAGLTLIYFPLLANDKVPGVDPMASDFLSTWNFVYTPEEIDKVVALAKANFDEGKEQTKRTIRAVWERKKKLRLEREKEERDLRRRMRLRAGKAIGRKGSGDHGDQFS